MWENPIEIIQTDIQYKVVDEYEKQILKAIQSYGISVNKKELVKALNYDRNQYEKGYADAKAEHRWIPCSERLPELDVPIVFTTAIGTLDVGFRIDSDTMNQFYSETGKCRRDNDDVIAWQYLPEPYKEGDDE